MKASLWQHRLVCIPTFAGVAAYLGPTCGANFFGEKNKIVAHTKYLQPWYLAYILSPTRSKAVVLFTSASVSDTIFTSKVGTKQHADRHKSQGVSLGNFTQHRPVRIEQPSALQRIFVRVLRPL